MGRNASAQRRRRIFNCSPLAIITEYSKVQLTRKTSLAVTHIAQRDDMDAHAKLAAPTFSERSDL